MIINSGTMLQVRLIEIGKFQLEEVPIPKPGKGQVLLKVKKAGICGSDIHTYRGENPVRKPPIILGHEVAGVVVKVGPGVGSIREGERVAVIPYISCGRCYYCLKGFPNLCSKLITVGEMPEIGAYAEYMLLPSELLLPIPSQIDLEEAVLIEPTAVAVHAVKQAGLTSKAKVAILGAGTIGLSILQIVRLHSVDKVLVADVVSDKLQLAKKMGADLVINFTKHPFLFIRKNKLLSLFDAVFDCVTDEKTLKFALDLVKKGQRVIVVGIPSRPLKIDFVQLICNELIVQGVFLYSQEDFIQASELITNREIDVRALISRTFPLTQISEAFQAIEESRGELIKVILNIDD